MGPLPEVMTVAIVIRSATLSMTPKVNSRAASYITIALPTALRWGSHSGRNRSKHRCAYWRQAGVIRCNISLHRILHLHRNDAHGWGAAHSRRRATSHRLSHHLQ